MFRPQLISGPWQLPSAPAFLELLKPITWFPPVWAFLCGAISSGGSLVGHLPSLVGGLLLCGPLLCASSQAVNDWFDRHVDAVNEPLRPIPSGRMPGYWGLWIAIGWSALSVVAAALLGATVAASALFGVAISWAYSAPPLRLKANGWLGNLACGLCYEGVAWMTGAFVIGGEAALSGRIIALALLYSVGAHGIMTLNDFKAIHGDRRFGIASLPVKYGPKRAAQIACLVMGMAQITVCFLLVAWHAAAYAIPVALLLLGQALMMRRFLRAPVEKALWYSGAGVPLFVAGMMVSAFALRGLAA